MSKTLWKVSVTTTVEGEDRVATLLEEQFNRASSSYQKSESSRIVVSIYSPTKVTSNGPELRGLRTALRAINKPELGAGKVSFEKVRHEDWANSWKRHFKPIEIGAPLLIRPAWSRRRPRTGQALVEIDPGLAFGTGFHPTTEFCLKELVKRSDAAKKQSLLDLGTGSGILAIAGAKLNYSPIGAIDCDPVAIRVALVNARQNGVARQIRFRVQNLTESCHLFSRPYDIVCANLISTLLITQRERIGGLVRPGGILVLAGILNREFPKVQRAYEVAGFKMTRARTRKEWRSGAFIRKF